MIDRADRRAWAAYVCAVVLCGICAGVVGALLIFLLNGVQLLTWGTAISHGLLAAVEGVPTWRLLLTLAAAGVVGALAWWGLQQTGHPPVGLRAAVNGTHMPLLPTLVHVVTQVVIVGMGASVGKEVAPREMSASLGGLVSDALHLRASERRILVASAAGAGLAAVYSVPVSGALFALEIFLVEITPRAVLTAASVSAIAVLVSHGAAGGSAYYDVPQLPADPAAIWWVLPMGLVLGSCGWGFTRLIRWSSGHRPLGVWLLLSLPVSFFGVGIIALAAPSVLGNGHELAQLAFSANVSGGGGLLLVMVCLALAKTVTTALTIGAGAWGGTLTPSVAIGGALGVAGGIVWSSWVPGTSLAVYAFFGAAMFLATTMRAPLTALALLVEFTHSGVLLLVPAALGVVIAVATSHLLDRLVTSNSSRRVHP